MDFWEFVLLAQAAGRIPTPLHVLAEEEERGHTGGE
jgi:hypothetical protein